MKRNEENLREKNGAFVLWIFIYTTFMTFEIMCCLVYSQTIVFTFNKLTSVFAKLNVKTTVKVSSKLVFEI